MSFNKNQAYARAIIMDRYEHPQNFINDPKDVLSYCSFNIKSPSCIDNLTAHVQLKGEVISDVKFSGIGCTISTATSDLIASLVKNQSVNQATKIINEYLKMIDHQNYDESLLGDLVIFSNVHQQLNRVKCAKVGIQALLEAIKLALQAK